MANFPPLDHPFFTCSQLIELTKGTLGGSNLLQTLAILAMEDTTDPKVKEVHDRSRKPLDYTPRQYYHWVGDTKLHALAP